MSFSALDSELTGPLFATEEMRAVFSDRARLSAMLQAEAALARAEARHGVAPEALADAIEAISVDELDLAALGAGTAVAGIPTIPFLAALRRRLPKELEPAFHRGATTQDIVDTALVLLMRNALALIGDDLAATVEGLARLAKDHRTTPCIGRTLGQHAAPITFGFKAAVWMTGVAEIAAELPWIRKRVLVASLGGPVGTLAGLGETGPAVLDAFAEELRLGTTPISWHTRRARMVEAGSWLATLIGALAKLATDVAHLASTEVGEVAEPHIPGRGGSSAMPHKRNPVNSTVILAAHAAAKGHVAILLDAMAAAHERPAGLWHGEWHALPQLFGLVSGALREAKALAEGLVVNVTRMRGNIDLTRGLIFADAAGTALAPTLGGEAAHRLVAEAADRVRTTDASLPQVLRDLLGPAAPGQALARAFDLSPSVEAAARWVDRALAAPEISAALQMAAVIPGPRRGTRDS